MSDRAKPQGGPVKLDLLVSGWERDLLLEALREHAATLAAQARILAAAGDCHRGSLPPISDTLRLRSERLLGLADMVEGRT